jgi:hypothetical protein
MAQRVQVELIDDLNGEKAQETVRFGIDGTDYEIDLTAENAEKLHTTLAEYVEKSRKANGRGRGGQKTFSSTTSSATNRSKREDIQKIRQWAQDNGHTTNSRGRISQTIVDAYNQAQK